MSHLMTLNGTKWWPKLSMHVEPVKKTMQIHVVYRY
jgi:hypothetical protein